MLVDLSTLSGAQDMMAAAIEAYGRIDVLVNNVGGTIWMKPFHLYNEEEIHQELERSLLPTLWGCNAVLPIMMEQEGGCIINLGSQSVRGLYRAPYASSKGGILALGKVLSMEYGRYGIRVNTVSPGGTDIPDRVTSRLRNKARCYGGRAGAGRGRCVPQGDGSPIFGRSNPCSVVARRKSKPRLSPFWHQMMPALLPATISIAAAANPRRGLIA